MTGEKLTPEAKAEEIIHLDPHVLTTHPVNEEIYIDRELPEEFVQSIDRNGILEPVVVTEDRETIISGHRRVRAAKQLDIDTIPCRVASFDSRADEVLALVDYNRQRDKTSGEKIREAQRYLENQKKRTKKIQREAGRLGGQVTGSKNSEKGSSNLTNASTDVRAEAAEQVGVSSGTISKGMTVLQAAEGSDVDERVQKVAQLEMDQLDMDEQSVHGAEQNVKAARTLNEFASSNDEIEAEVAQSKFDTVIDGTKSARDALDEAKREIKRRQQKRDIEEGETPTPPDGKYDVIVADPPWPYDDNAWKSEHRGTVPYPTMSLDELKNIDVPASEDAILWLWFPNAFVQEATQLVQEWGFDQKTILSWIKNKMGTGHWLRNQTEHVIFAVRGSPDVNYPAQSTYFKADVAGHSEKPEEFYEIVEDGCQGSKLELFARESRDGWAAFGDEVE